MIDYFEEMREGARIELGTFEFTAKNIKAFAIDYDPQRFHVDETAAKDSLFGGLCASGWHTASVWMRLMVDYYMADAGKRLATGNPVPKLGPSPGFRDLKWLRPVYAGDIISYSSTVHDKIDIRSKPGWGLLVSFNEGRNQQDKPVISFLGQVFLERRP